MSADFAAVVSPQVPGLSSALRKPSPTPTAQVKEQPTPAEAVELPAETQDPLAIDQAVRWPPQVAILRVHMEGKDEFRLEGLNAAVDHLPYRASKPYRRPNLALGAIARKGGKAPRTILQTMPEWSKKFQELHGWLNTLRERFGEDLHLLIIDATGFDVPWELLYLPEHARSGKEAGWLGALVPTARWAHHALQDRSVERHGGHVLGYLEGSLGGLTRERGVIDQLKAVVHEASNDFLEALRTAYPEVGLVFMACHGLFNNPSTAESRLGGLSLGALWEEELRHKGLHLLRESRCVAFLNACHSGRLGRDDDLGDQPTDDLRGFVDVFLRNGASGVIATLGEVGTTFAADLGVLLLREAMNDDGAAIARLLRDRRAQADHERLELGPEADPRALLPFLYAFMYVFYGDPLTILRLTRRDHAGDSS